MLSSDETWRDSSGIWPTCRIMVHFVRVLFGTSLELSQHRGTCLVPVSLLEFMCDSNYYYLQFHRKRSYVLDDCGK